MTYALWNIFILGTLFAGYMFGQMQISGLIIGILYCLILPTMFLCMLIQDKVDDINKVLLKHKPYIFILEIMYIGFTFYMGYKKIAVCMASELFMYLYMYVKAIKNKGKDK